MGLDTLNSRQNYNFIYVSISLSKRTINSKIKGQSSCAFYYKNWYKSLNLILRFLMLRLQKLKTSCISLRQRNILKTLTSIHFSWIKSNVSIQFICVESQLSLPATFTVCYRFWYIMAMTGCHCRNMNSKRFVFSTAVQKNMTLVQNHDVTFHRLNYVFPRYAGKIYGCILWN